MARDIRVINRDGYNDRCRFYKRKTGEVNKFEELPSGIFYCKVVVPEEVSVNIINGKIKDKLHHVSVETLDVVVDLIVDDRVQFRGELWSVDKIIRDEFKLSTRFNNRPMTRTTITLRR